MNHTHTPSAHEMAHELESLRAERAVAAANRDRLAAQLHTATADAAQLRALVKSGAVAASELAKPQAEAENLRGIVAELETEIADLNARIETLAGAQSIAARRERLTAIANDASAARARFLAHQRATAEALGAGLKAMRAEAQTLARLRDAFATEGAPLLERGGDYQARLDSADEVLALVESAGADVAGIADNRHSFSGARFARARRAVSDPSAHRLETGVAAIFNEGLEGF